MPATYHPLPDLLHVTHNYLPNLFSVIFSRSLLVTYNLLPAILLLPPPYNPLPDLLPAVYIPLTDLLPVIYNPLPFTYYLGVILSVIFVFVGVFWLLF